MPPLQAPLRAHRSADKTAEFREGGSPPPSPVPEGQPGWARTSRHTGILMAQGRSGPLGASASSLTFGVSTWEPWCNQVMGVTVKTAPDHTDNGDGTGRGHGQPHGCEMCQVAMPILRVRADACCGQTRARLSRNLLESQQDGVFELAFLSPALALGSPTSQDSFHTTGSRVQVMLRGLSSPPARLALQSSGL